MPRKQSAGIFENIGDSLGLSVVRFAFACFLSAAADSRVTILIAFRLLVWIHLSYTALTILQYP